ncbi:MAG: polysaccharide deacetylase family protein [Salinivirgaceae bacterium]|nr:polysaccharide deacetylase family protein [Salinivirgaceae bacterium]
MYILTIDVEDWYHLINNRYFSNPKNWYDNESRLMKNLEIITSLLEKYNQKASFFIVGWIAEKYPAIIKMLTQLDFEIGSHSYLHQTTRLLNKKAFFADTEKSIKTIEDISGKKINSYRMPAFSIDSTNKWVFDVLSDLGIKYDSSLTVINRRNKNIHPYKIKTQDGNFIKELPVSTFKYLGMNFNSGSGYFRILPLKKIIKSLEKKDYTLLYFHPRDFDSKTPISFKVSLLQNLKNQMGLKHSACKFETVLNNFKFTDIQKASLKIDWENTKDLLF